MILLNLDDELLAEEEGSFDKSFEIKMQGSTFFPSLSKSTTPRTDSTCSPITRSSSDPKSEGEIIFFKDGNCCFDTADVFVEPLEESITNNPIEISWRNMC